MCFVIARPPAQNFLKEMHDCKITILGFKMREEMERRMMGGLVIISVSGLWWNERTQNCNLRLCSLVAVLDVNMEKFHRKHGI